MNFKKLLCLFLVLLSGTAFAINLDPIPAETNIVFVINNHSGLQLVKILEVAPIPAQARSKIDEAISATGFNPFRDITRIQGMVQKGETKPDDKGVVLLSGSFDEAKIVSFLEKAKGGKITKEKIGNLECYMAPNGKGAVCFLGADKVAIGSPEKLKAVIEGGPNAANPDFDFANGLLNEKAYVTLLVGDKAFLKAAMDKKRERRKKRAEGKGRNKAVNEWAESYLSDGVEPVGAWAQLVETGIEFKLLYLRDGNQNSITGGLEINDPKIGIKVLFDEFLKAVPGIIQEKQGK